MQGRINHPIIISLPIFTPPIPINLHIEYHKWMIIPNKCQHTNVILKHPQSFLNLCQTFLNLFSIHPLFPNFITNFIFIKKFPNSQNKFHFLLIVLQASHHHNSILSISSILESHFQFLLIHFQQD